MAKSKSVTVDGVDYASKSDAIRALLAEGVRKCDVAKTVGANYSFVVTVERKAITDESPEGIAAQKAREQAKADRNAKREAEKKAKAEAREAREAERAEKRAKREAEKKAKADERAKREAEKKAKADERAKKKAEKQKALKKAVARSKNKKKRKTQKPTNTSDIVNEAVTTDEIPADILEDMKKDGLA